MSAIRSQATPARDELAAYLDRVIDNEAWANTGAEAAKHIEEQLGWSKPRTVNSTAELDALPVGAVVWTPALVGPVGHIFVKCAGMWIIPWHDAAEDPLEQNGSVTVIFTPGEAG